MKAVYEVKDNKNELIVTVDGEQWETAQKKAFNKIANSVTIPGFRKGKAPTKMLKQYVNDQQVQYEAVEAVAQEALEFGLAENKEIRLVDRPMLDIKTVNSEEAVLVFGLTVYPEVELGDYKAVKYTKKKVSVLKKDVDARIDTLLKKEASEVLKEEGTVNKGDIAVIDFEGFVDGVAFEGGKGTEYPLEIGSGAFIPGFEDQIIGMATGEEKDVNVTFPKDYMEDLAGKDATFKVKVEGIKEKVLPELNDEFVKELKYAEGVETVDALTKKIKEEIKARKSEEAENDATNALLDGLCEACKVEIPECMVNQEVEDTYNQQAQQMQAQGFTMDMYLQITGSTPESFKETLKESSEKKVRIRVILDAIAKDLGVEVTDEEREEEFAAMASNYGMEVEKIKELVPADYLDEDLKIRKALETLKNSAE